MRRGFGYFPSTAFYHPFLLHTPHSIDWIEVLHRYISDDLCGDEGNVSTTLLGFDLFQHPSRRLSHCHLHRALKNLVLCYKRRKQFNEGKRCIWFSPQWMLKIRIELWRSQHHSYFDHPLTCKVCTTYLVVLSHNGHDISFVRWP